jgi:PAS domain S-box-containing protein
MATQHRDLTRREPFESVAKQKEILQKIFDHLPVMISFADPTGHVVLVNREWERTMGWTLAELQRQNLDIFDLAYPDPRERRKVLDFVASADGVPGEFSMKVRDGRTIDVVWRRFRLADGTSFGIGQDITERKQAEESLRAAQRRTESILASVADTHILFDHEWRYQYLNDAAVSAIGRPREQIVGRTLWDLYPEIVGTELDRQYRRAMEERKQISFEFHFVTTDSWWENRFYPVSEGLAVFATDITARQQAEAERARLATIVRSSDDAIIGTTLDGTIVSWNEGARRIFGYTADEIIGCSAATLIPPDRRDELRQVLERLERGESLDHYETVRVRKDGRHIDVSVTISPIRDAAAKTIGASVIARDTTERKRTEDAIRASQQQLRALSAHLQTIREEERSRIAREIHDELGQVLTGLKMELSLVEESWSTSPISDAFAPYRSAFTRMRDLVDGSIHTVRKIAIELRPMMLDSLGLSAAIEWQVDEFVKASGLPCELSMPEDDVALDRETSTAIFRILQESLTNIVRHAKASRVSVQLSNDDRTTTLRVIDNGVGIPAQAMTRGTSFGLLGMKERALMLGGSLDLVSGSGGGTTLTVRLPHQRGPAKGDAPLG